ncbi:transmembrane protein 17-like [Styela clava]
MASVTSGPPVLTPHMRQALSNLSNKLFMQGNSKYDNFTSQLPGNEILTNLPLQMTMYFNVYLFPFWFTTYCVMLGVKYSYLGGTFKVILIAMLILYTLIEIARLYLGYIGNLQEKVPELAGFLLLSAPQIVLILILLAHPDVILLPMEGVMHTILLLMIVIELLSGLSTLSAMTRQQATKFRLQQFIDLENMNTPLVEEHNQPDEVGRFQ